MLKKFKKSPVIHKTLSILNSEKGQGMSEYGLLIALISVVVIVAVTAIGIAINNKFVAVKDALQ